MYYWVKDCECERNGVLLAEPAVRFKEDDGVFTLTFTIDPYHCAYCGKAYKKVQESEKAQEEALGT